MAENKDNQHTKIDPITGFSKPNSDFTKELEEFVKEHHTDNAIHSLKSGEDIGSFGYGATLTQLTNNDIKRLKKGEILGFYDGEYVHFFIYASKPNKLFSKNKF
jgi:hypothetical protein